MRERDRDNGHTPIHNSLNENKISRNKPNQGGDDFYIENFKPLKANNEKDARNQKTTHTYSLVEPML